MNSSETKRLGSLTVSVHGPLPAHVSGCRRARRRWGLAAAAAPILAACLGVEDGDSSAEGGTDEALTTGAAPARFLDRNALVSAVWSSDDAQRSGASGFMAPSKTLTPDGRVLLVRPAANRGLVRFTVLAQPNKATPPNGKSWLRPDALLSNGSNYVDILLDGAETGGGKPPKPDPSWNGPGLGLMAVGFDPRYGDAAPRVPSPSKCVDAGDGAPLSLDPAGEYECYRLIVYQSAQYSKPNPIRGEPDLGAMRLLQGRVTFAVRAFAPAEGGIPGPRLRQPEILPTWGRRLEDLGFSSARVEGDVTQFAGNEFGVTADSRLLVMRERGDIGIDAAPVLAKVKNYLGATPAARQSTLWDSNYRVVFAYAFNDTPWRRDAWTEPRHLRTIKQNVASLHPVVHPRMVLQSTGTVTELVPDVSFTAPFASLYKIAARPDISSFRAPNGSPKGDSVVGGKYYYDNLGGYTWISQDGTDLINAETLIGYSTGFYDQGLNGPLSPYVQPLDDYPVPRSDDSRKKRSFAFFMQGFGSAGGFWQPFRGVSRSTAIQLPMNRRLPNYLMMQAEPRLRYYIPDPSNPRINCNEVTDGAGCDEMAKVRGTSPEQFLYGEVPLDDYLDGNYLFFHHFAARGPTSRDASGNGHKASRFQAALDHDGSSQLRLNAGFLGPAAFVPGPGERAGLLVEHALSGTPETLYTGEERRELSFEMAFLPTAAWTGNVDLVRANAFRVYVTADKKLRLTFGKEAPIDIAAPAYTHATVSLPDIRFKGTTGFLSPGDLSKAQVTPLIGPTLFPDAAAWRHLGFTFRAARDAADVGTISVYLDGRLVRRVPTRLASLTIDANDAIVIGSPSGPMMVDEVALSKVARGPDHFATAAFASSRTADWATPLPSDGSLGVAALTGARIAPARLKLPTGLDDQELRIPVDVAAAMVDVAKFRRLVSLGRELFGSTVLSSNAGGTPTVSCGTCHSLSEGFARKGQVRAPSLTTTQLLNSPTLVNRALGGRQFHDQRADSLVDQVWRPILNPNEMGGRFEDVVAQVNAVYGSTYKDLFDAYGGKVATVVALALACYEVTIFSGNSVFDRLMAGEPVVGADVQAIFRGKSLFEGRARCVGCHSGTNFTDERLHVTGSAGNPAEVAAAFKTPTLRSLNLTGPYFHDGSKVTLRDVVDFYDRGVPTAAVAGVNVDAEFRPLGLSDQEKRDLVAFLASLSGTVTEGTANVRD